MTHPQNRIITCRYLNPGGSQCTGEAADPDGEILLCEDHLRQVFELLTKPSNGARAQ